MAKIELRHLDCLDSDDFITVKNRTDMEAVLIEMVLYDDLGMRTGVHEIYLDKSTAIRFAKSVRTEINKIK
jgi:hypothetical protein